MLQWVYITIIVLIWTLFVFAVIYQAIIKKFYSGRASLYLTLGIYLIPLFLTWGFVIVPELMRVGYVILSTLAGIVILLGSLFLNSSISVTKTKTVKRVTNKKYSLCFEDDIPVRNKSVSKAYSKKIF